MTCIAHSSIIITQPMFPYVTYYILTALPLQILLISHVKFAVNFYMHPLIFRKTYAHILLSDVTTSMPQMAWIFKVLAMILLH